MQVHKAMRLPKSFYKVPMTQKQLKSDLFLMLEIRKQWFILMHGKKMQGLLLTIIKKGHPEIPWVYCKLLKIKIYWNEHVQKKNIDFKFDLQR